MEEAQVKFIFDKLDTYPVCAVHDKYTNRLKEVSTPAVRNILNQKFVRGTDMKAVLCMFDTLFLTSTKGREKGLHNLSQSVRKWITKMKKLDVASVQGFVYTSDILSEDIQVVIKVPQEVDGFDGLVREYFLGITTLNNLRYHIPTFVYTLGAFLCPLPKQTKTQEKLCSPRTSKKRSTKQDENTAFVMYEKIPGQSMENLLQANEIKFPQFLEIFIQILVSLEVAQRETQFTHFDLHAGNVMIRPVSGYSYPVPIENISYDLTAKELLPVIIDYGFATSVVDGTVIGEFGFEGYGMMHFMVPGYDMFKFLVYCAKNASPKLRGQISTLFAFYGKDDPYGIATTGTIEKTLKVATKHYCASVTYSNAAKYTPLMFIEWLMNHKTFGKIIKPYLKVRERREYLPLHFSSTIQEYDGIFQHSQEGRNQAVELTDQCLKAMPSYVMTMYNTKLLSGYNNHLQDRDIASKIKAIKAVVKSEKDYMIGVDMEMLQKYTQIPLPSARDITKAAHKMLSIDIRSKQTRQAKLGAINGLDVFEFYGALEPYLQFVYTIREVGAEDDFREFLNEFLSSPQYLLYTKNATLISQTLRWSESIKADIGLA